MKFKKAGIEGCYVVDRRSHDDMRGSIHHVFQNSDLQKSGIDFSIQEAIFSVSSKNVLKGMHFQLPPRSTARLVACLSGEVFDAVIDLRKQSPTFMNTFTISLSENDNRMMFIPEGVAHGFCSVRDHTTVLYMISGVHSPEHDTGIRWDSVPIKWPSKDPIVSERDRQLMPLEQFDSPF
jgi:dTDP-4-dehydrorhamnose 3,5-epimerase